MEKETRDPQEKENVWRDLEMPVKTGPSTKYFVVSKTGRYKEQKVHVERNENKERRNAMGDRHE
jgi:hypothetical protein